MPPHVLTGGRLQSVLRLPSLQKSRRPTTWFPYSAEADDDGHLGRTTPRLEVTRIFLPLLPRLPGQPFAIKHRVYEKKSKFRPFLGAAGVEDAKRFVAFVLEASGRLGPDAGAFLDYLLRTLCRFPILRFRALTSVISAKHNAQMVLRWVRYLRRPI